MGILDPQAFSWEQKEVSDWLHYSLYDRDFAADMPILTHCLYCLDVDTVLLIGTIGDRPQTEVMEAKRISGYHTLSDTEDCMRTIIPVKELEKLRHVSELCFVACPLSFGNPEFTNQNDIDLRDFFHTCPERLVRYLKSSLTSLFYANDGAWHDSLLADVPDPAGMILKDALTRQYRNLHKNDPFPLSDTIIMGLLHMNVGHAEMNGRDIKVEEGETKFPIAAAPPYEDTEDVLVAAEAVVRGDEVEFSETDAFRHISEEEAESGMAWGPWFLRFLAFALVWLLLRLACSSL